MWRSCCTNASSPRCAANESYHYGNAPGWVYSPRQELKTKVSRTPIPIPASLAAELSAQIARYGRYGTLLTGEDGRQLSPWSVERAMQEARKKVQGLPAGFRYHDLRSDVVVELELSTVLAVPAAMPLSWDFIERWLASFGDADQRQPEQRRNRSLRSGTCRLFMVTTTWCSPSADLGDTPLTPRPAPAPAPQHTPRPASIQ